jgi:hypothetical protein
MTTINKEVKFDNFGNGIINYSNPSGGEFPLGWFTLTLGGNVTDFKVTGTTMSGKKEVHRSIG